jgi:hypothetical protein
MALFATPPEDVKKEGCKFYCSIDLPDGTFQKGQWDLRDTIDEYLAGYDFAGKRVLEIGPASGFISFYMERMGADVTCVEIDEGTDWNFVPQANLDLEVAGEKQMASIRKVKNSFWYCHNLFQSRAKVWHGDASKVPPDIGQFDTVMFASVLLHCRNITDILDRCCSLATKDAIIVERSFPSLGDVPVCFLDPSKENGHYDTWWRFTPQFFERYLGIIGFNKFHTTYHVQESLRKKHGVPAVTKTPYFTLVASR